MKTLVIHAAEFVRCSEKQAEQMIRKRLLKAGFNLKAPYKKYTDPVNHTITVVQDQEKKTG